MTEHKKGNIDIINEVLEAAILAYPISPFVISLYKQYISRGWLTKKQMEGLYAKAQKIDGLAAGKLASLEALIRKMPTRTKSEVPPPAPLYVPDAETGAQLASVLQKYPQHKRALFLRSKYQNNEPLTAAERTELKRFYGLVK